MYSTNPAWMQRGRLEILLSQNAPSAGAATFIKFQKKDFPLLEIIMLQKFRKYVTLPYIYNRTSENHKCFSLINNKSNLLSQNGIYRSPVRGLLSWRRSQMLPNLGSPSVFFIIRPSTFIKFIKCLYITYSWYIETAELRGRHYESFGAPYDFTTNSSELRAPKHFSFRVFFQITYITII